MNIWDIKKKRYISERKLAAELNRLHKGHLAFPDIEAITKLPDYWAILDECGNWDWIPPDRFSIEEEK